MGIKAKSEVNLREHLRCNCFPRCDFGTGERLRLRIGVEIMQEKIIWSESFMRLFLVSRIFFLHFSKI